MATTLLPQQYDVSSACNKMFGRLQGQFYSRKRTSSSSRGMRLMVAFLCISLQVWCFYNSVRASIYASMIAMQQTVADLPTTLLGENVESRRRGEAEASRRMDETQQEYPNTITSAAVAATGTNTTTVITTTTTSSSPLMPPLPTTAKAQKMKDTSKNDDDAGLPVRPSNLTLSNNKTRATGSTAVAMMHSLKTATQNKTETIQHSAKTSVESVLVEQQLQMDIMVPASGRDSRLRQFVMKLQRAIQDYAKRVKLQNKQQPRISVFRLLVTRFSAEEQSKSLSFRKELAFLTGIKLEHILVLNTGNGVTFSRARALNYLHEAACHLDTCLVAGIDLDMEIRSEFFQHAIETVHLRQVPPLDTNILPWYNDNLPPGSPVVYFPIVWSAYNPETVRLVEQNLIHNYTTQESLTYDKARQKMKQTMPEFSEHRGNWRIFGKGMYVMSGNDALLLNYSTSFEGWGGEDGDFFQRVLNLPRQIVRINETGLIHQWHPKQCRFNVDVFTEQQHTQCLGTAQREDGSELGQWLKQQQQQNKKKG